VAASIPGRDSPREMRCGAAPARPNRAWQCSPEPPLKWRHVVVGTRFCASAARPTAGNAVLEQRPLPILPTAFHGDPAKKSTPESPEPPGSIVKTCTVVPPLSTCSSTFTSFQQLPLTYSQPMTPLL
jgi:hypothetical protein